MYTLADSLTKFNAPLQLERILSRRTMTSVRTTLFLLTLGGGTGALALYLVPALGNYALYLPQVLGVTMLAGGLWLEQMLTYGYHNSHYFYGLNSIIGLDEEPVSGATYDTAQAVYAHPHDVTRAFCESRLGSIVLLRAGIDSATAETFLREPRQKIRADAIPLPANDIFTLIGLGRYLLQHDVAFAALFKTHGITEETYLGALRWVVGSYHQYKRRLRWWSRDNLSRTKGIGQELAYGVAYVLERFSRDIRTSAVFSNLTSSSPFAEEKVIEIETNLARAKASNILIIGEAGVGKMDLVLAVNTRMQTGKSLAAIAGKQMIVLDTNRLFAVQRGKQEIELTILQLFDEALGAGNIIIVIENISNFIREAEALGVFVPELLDPYLAHPELNIIATDTPGAYHTYLEPLGAFARRFAEVLIDSPDMSATTRVLQGIAEQHEGRYNTLFSYAALTAITTAADRFIVEGVMPDKAIELLIDIATRAGQNNISFITSDYVYTVVSEKTGVPAGPISDQERDLLLQLSERLHERVIGQQPALDAIARTMRRARAGIQASDKPIGSFLFLGPTGVGKTETAKALAYIFFGGEEHMQRLDMSEFSGVDALERLLGDGTHSGTLPDMLREHPYSVLLLDEFEKAAQPVHDLFLQILDEGMFTDARGMKVNARNTIIIATSNAGSQLILKTIQQRQELSHLTQEIIDHIVKTGVYRPELINRFDNTIIFEPLSKEEQGQVASLMLGGLYKRVAKQGYELVVTKDLLDILVDRGYSPEFGLRPMQRVLQDVVEEAIAQKIISGGVSLGGTITLTAADVPST